MATSLAVSAEAPRPFTRADRARLLVFLDRGTTSPADHALAREFLQQLLAHVDRLTVQRAALRRALRELLIEHDGRLCYRSLDDAAAPALVPVAIEALVRDALAEAQRGALSAPTPSAAAAPRDARS